MQNEKVHPIARPTVLGRKFALPSQHVACVPFTTPVGQMTRTATPKEQCSLTPMTTC